MAKRKAKAKSKPVRKRRKRRVYRLKGPYEARKYRVKAGLEAYNEKSLSLALTASEKSLNVLAALHMDIDWGGDDGMEAEVDAALQACRQVALHRQKSPLGF